jgi:hypothetical protein
MCHHRRHHAGGFGPPRGSRPFDDEAVGRGPAVRASDADDLLHGRPEIRASDAEREAVAERLRAHGAAGRLDVDDLEERVGAAYAAATRGELARLLEDLPGSGATRPAPRVQRRAPRRDPRADVRVFVAVNLLLIAIWAFTGAGYFWPGWVLLWWGVALGAKVLPALSRPRGGAT